MLAILGSKIFLYIAIAGIVVAGYFYWQHIIEENAILKQNQEVLEKGIETQKETISNIQREVSQVKEESNRVNETANLLIKDSLELQNKLNKRLETLAERKPGLIETRINKGTKDANRCLEIASGSPLTNEEKNATKKSEFNTICPSIANPASLN